MWRIRLAIIACLSACAREELAEPTHVDPADIEAETDDTAAGCDATAHLRVENRSSAVLNWITVCDADGCGGYLDGIGAEPGEDWEVDACPGEVSAIAADVEDNCIALAEVTLTEAAVYVWTITTLDGEWSSDGTECVTR